MLEARVPEVAHYIRAVPFFNWCTLGDFDLMSILLQAFHFWCWFRKRADTLSSMHQWDRFTSLLMKPRYARSTSTELSQNNFILSTMSAIISIVTFMTSAFLGTCGPNVLTELPASYIHSDDYLCRHSILKSQKPELVSPCKRYIGHVHHDVV